MKPSRRKKLEKLGFKFGTVQEFLQLSDEDMALIDLKIRLIEMLKDARKTAGMTQHQVAKLIGSSQSRIAKVESGDPDVSLDLICKALFALGISRRSLGRKIATKHAA
jgi:DNA-binding XRE family transcriptional regulator